MKRKVFFLALITVFFSCNKKEIVLKKTPKNVDTIAAKDSVKTSPIEKTTDSTACVDVVIEILTTSPSYIKDTKGLYEAVVKNGGTSIGITVEGSPNPKTDKALSYSETYDLSLHETYPDRMPTIARYTFDPSKNQLFEYDVVEDTLMPLKFNKNLLSKFLKACK
ncbi:hypothetical protein ACFSJW_21515 [Flavobacterium artemisiae]|uniref:Lipoprotein n=1 Tax=Flavobacterium artemisiae TaxID=2126556 RepID=A0ABW4HAU5_9FLAO